MNITSYSTRVNIVCQSTVIKLRILRGSLSPGLSGWALPKCHVLIRGRQRAIWQLWRQGNHRGRDWVNVATNQGMLTATRSWKRWGMDSSLGPSAGVQSCRLSHQACGHCYSSHRKLIYWVWWPSKQCGTRGVLLSWRVTWPKKHSSSFCNDQVLLFYNEEKHTQVIAICWKERFIWQFFCQDGLTREMREEKEKW